MARLVHSAVHWTARCILDSSSEDENVPPNVQRGGTQAPAESAKSSSPGSTSFTGTTTVLWMSPQHGLRAPKEVSNPPTKASTAGATVTTPLTTDPVPTTAGVTAATAPETDPATPATPPPTRNPHNPTTSSPLLLEGPPSPHPRSSPPPDRRPLRERHSSRSERRAAAGPYERRERRHEATSPTVAPNGVMRAARGSASLVPARPARTRGVHYQGRFVPARWPFYVAHLRTQFNPTGVIFPAVPHFGWCDCEDPCRVGRCRNSLMQLYCNVNCCPYSGNCGNGLVESTKVALARNVVTRQLAVVAQQFIAAGVVLGKYLGEIEHVSASHAARPRNEGYRLVMTQRPETPSHPVRVAVNAQQMGGLMRFVNHSCAPVVHFLEVANGRQTTVVVATAHAIDEITVDYRPDLWVVCRCGHANCRHGDIQH